MVKKHFGQVPHPVPIPAIIVLVIAWYLGEQYDKYVYLSTRDSLTGLYNRRYVTDKFPNLSRCANRRKLNICTLLVDVNDFKEINDHYGHDAGDVVLANISKKIVRFFWTKVYYCQMGWR
ncbi:GGDEF domain-containing protein (plasmid) [Peribacillus sp. JNUCC 23]